MTSGPDKGRSAQGTDADRASAPVGRTSSGPAGAGGNRTLVGFLRPRMGIGGSERLVADAAVALRQRGRDVRLFVPSPDTMQFPSLAANKVVFEPLRTIFPHHLFGGLQAPLAVARAVHGAWGLSRSTRTPDVIFCDVVPHVIPLAKRLTGRPVLYFCHYPDLLLTSEGSRASFAYRAYRRSLDVLEERGLSLADLIVTNSRFTLQTLKTTFPMLRPEAMTVLYPGVAVPSLALPWPAGQRELVILSVSRFDRRKNLALAIEAIAAMRMLVTADLFATVKLVFAGAYDKSRPDEVSLVAELQQRARAARIEQHVEFVFSPTEKERLALLGRSQAVIYTPLAEHFGYVPVEAMAAGRPVVAVNAGGPAETVISEQTGFLCEPTADAFGAALAEILVNRGRSEAMGVAAHAHVAAQFSLERFGDGLHNLIGQMIADSGHRRQQAK